MSLQYMLDTNILSSLMKNPDGAVSKKIEKAGERSIIVACELRYGAEKKQSDALTRRCLLYTSPSPRDQRGSRMPSSA